MSILLTEEEIEAITKPMIMIDSNVIAKAQLKKVAGWGGEDCPHSQPPSDSGNSYQPLILTPLKKRECPECWQALLKETE